MEAYQVHHFERNIHLHQLYPIQRNMHERIYNRIDQSMACLPPFKEDPKLSWTKSPRILKLLKKYDRILLTQTIQGEGRKVEN